MHLAPKINRGIARMQTTLRGRVPLETVLDQVQAVCSPWRANVYLQPDPTLAAHASCSISGSYNSSKKRRPIDIMLHFNDSIEVYNFTPRRWRSFRFLLSSVLQHELIHRDQYTCRPAESKDSCLYYDVKAGAKSDKEYMDYLAELDEIDAYAHDIAMEIKEYYPTVDPYEVLATIDQRDALWSWFHYRDTFKDSEDWSMVHNRLLKKTYLWLPHVTV